MKLMKWLLIVAVLSGCATPQGMADWNAMLSNDNKCVSKQQQMVLYEVKDTGSFISGLMATAAISVGVESNDVTFLSNLLEKNLANPVVLASQNQGILKATFKQVLNKSSGKIVKSNKVCYIGDPSDEKEVSDRAAKEGFEFVFISNKSSEAQAITK